VLVDGLFFAVRLSSFLSSKDCTVQLNFKESIWWANNTEKWFMVTIRSIDEKVEHIKI